MSIPQPRGRVNDPIVRKRRRRSFVRTALRLWLLRTVVVAVALVLGFSVVCKILRPIRLVGNERRERAKIVSDYQTLTKQNDALRRQLAYLKTPEGIAQEARKQGLVKPGEIPLVISEDGYPTK